MIITHKTECFPNSEQINFLNKCFGARRFFFNKTIIYLKDKYGDLKENRKLIHKKEIMQLRKILFRDKHPDVVESAPSVILDTTMEDVMFALNSLWKRGKEIKLRKKKDSNTCRFFRKNHTSFKYINGEKIIHLIRLPNLKLAESLRWNNAEIKTATIKKTAGRYFISITCEIPDLAKPKNKNRHLGVDWGLTTYLTCYDGKDLLSFDFNEDILRKLDRKIAKYQRKLSKKEEGSNNFAKVTTKLQQAYLDFNNYREDAVKKLVYELSLDYDSVTLEGLGMSFVFKNRYLAHRAKEKPFYLFKITLLNKFKALGKKVFVAPRSYPSTQTCNACGYIKIGKEKMKLGEKTFSCPSCKSKFNRDDNAAMNLYALKGLEEASLDD